MVDNIGSMPLTIQNIDIEKQDDNFQDVMDEVLEKELDKLITESIIRNTIDDLKQFQKDMEEIYNEA